MHTRDQSGFVVSLGLGASDFCVSGTRSVGSGACALTFGALTFGALTSDIFVGRDASECGTVVE